ncbi:nadp-dependent alcohol dehydrogenase [Colletotrichum asianum]|uniref:Nadp-dependent alcohol dehydrogenase n=1 Tax=Colletotrichum asianum TaxID=702518 RepID=A0A8H3ZML1_9PEZI|nr:nadp-dependent alcohol dehydrogenase [Colletotrichum asianum]
MSAIKFEGWLGLGPDSAKGKMEWGSFEPKAWTENDIDIQISHCGICGSDLHTLRSGWGKTDYLSNSDMPLQQYLSLLKWGGSFVQVGSPDGGKLPEISAFTLIMNNIQVGGSNIGSVSQIQEMLEFAVRQNVKPWIQTRSMNDANQAIVDMEDGKARYRYVLVNERHFGVSVA